MLIADALKDILKVAIIHNWKITNSQVSWWEICTRGLKQESLKDTILDAGEYLNDKKMLDTFLSNIENQMTELSRKYKVEPSYLWAKSNIWNIFSEIEKNLEWKVDYIIWEVASIDSDNDRYKWVQLYDKSSDSFRYIISQSLLIVAWGFADLFSFNDYVSNQNCFSPLWVCMESWLTVQDLEFMMIHPFWKKSKNQHLNWTIQKTDNLAQKKVEWLRNKNIDILQDYLDSHNAHNNFSNILKIFRENEEVTVGWEMCTPLVHYTIWWLKVNEKFMTSLDGVFSYWESACWVSGAWRVWWISLAEIISLSQEVSENIKKYNSCLVPKDKLSKNKISNSYKISIWDIEKQKHQISEILDYKVIYWGNTEMYTQALEKLQKIPDSSYKTLAIWVVKSMLNRKESRGMFYRSDYPKKWILTYHTVIENISWLWKMSKKYENNFYRLQRKIFYIK